MKHSRRRRSRGRGPRLLIVALTWILVTSCDRPRLAGHALLPADTFAAGPTSGQFIEAVNGRQPPFPDRQPVQGFSALLDDGEGRFLAMSDNGFGGKRRSADYLLRVYRLRPDFRSSSGGGGTMRIDGHFTLRDPARVIPFPIVADAKLYPAADPEISVDEQIRAQRLLTGADFDIESFRRMPDGSFWFGDEFGPWLLHTDGSGSLLEAPVATPGVRSEHNPTRNGLEANTRSGFEGLALDRSGTLLYAMLQRPLEKAAGHVNIYTFDPQTRRFRHSSAGNPPFLYPLDSEQTSIGELTAISDSAFLVIERDAKRGRDASVKRVYRIDLDRIDRRGYLVKQLLVDLLDIDDPDHLGGPGDTFRFSCKAIEALVVIDPFTLGLINDNGYPFNTNRRADMPGEPEDTEFILIRLARPLH